MQIHKLETKKRKDSKRIGRGGCRGTYSGRGMKGQKARSGGNVDPLFEGGRSSLIKRMKKLRGFKSPHTKKTVVTLADLNRVFADGETISVLSLIEKKLLRNKFVKNGVKIVARGEMSKKLTVAEDVLMTIGAKEAIEKAGGKTVEDKKEIKEKK